jgi:hypothetical protein
LSRALDRAYNRSVGDILLSQLNCSYIAQKPIAFSPSHFTDYNNMSGNSNVGNSQVYESGDQRTVPDSVIEQEKRDKRFHEGKENSHKANDSSKVAWSAFRYFKL